MKQALTLCAVIALAGAAIYTIAPGEKPAPSAAVISADTAPDLAASHIGANTFAYDGRWEWVTHADGRFAGTSARSYTPGAWARASFRGTHVRLYGIRGANGGWGRVDGDATGGRPVRVSFWNAQKQPHALLYESGQLPEGIHRLTLTVLDGSRNAGRRGYVNVSDVEVSP